MGLTGYWGAAQVLPLAEQAVTDAQAAVDGIQESTVIEVGEVQVAVFACDAHAIDPEAAVLTSLHEPDCKPGSCGCQL